VSLAEWFTAFWRNHCHPRRHESSEKIL